MTVVNEITKDTGKVRNCVTLGSMTVTSGGALTVTVSVSSKVNKKAKSVWVLAKTVDMDVYWEMSRVVRVAGFCGKRMSEVMDVKVKMSSTVKVTGTVIDLSVEKYSCWVLVSSWTTSRVVESMHVDVSVSHFVDV